MNMNEYELGRDFQVLRSRIDHLESVIGEDFAKVYSRHGGIAECRERSFGATANVEPLHWSPKELTQLPPFVRAALGVPHRLAQFNVRPESKTWTGQPDPSILTIQWDNGGIDEFYRFQNQIFSIVRITEPNSGHVSCTATYSARLIASGKAKSRSYYRSTVGGFYASSIFRIMLRGAQGANLGLHESPKYSIFCNENYEFVQYWDFNPGLYDLITAATWEVVGPQAVDRC
jgi:hypothetical protein